MLSPEILIGICLGLVLLPRLLTALQAILSVVRARLAAAIACLVLYARAAWRGAGQLLTTTEAGVLRPAVAIAQVVGGTMLTAAGVIFVVCDLALTWATLAPLFGMEFHPQGSLLTSFDWLLGLSVVLLAVAFGFVLSDLFGWTMLTRFAVVRHGRVGALCLAFLGLLASLAIAVALAAYRLPALLGEGGPEAPLETLAWVQLLPAPILLTLAAVLLPGAALALLSVETFCAAVVALLLTVGGGVLGLGSLLLRVVDLVAEVVGAGVAALAMEPMTQGMTESLHRLGQGIANRGKAFGAWLHTLVHREAPSTVQASGSAPLAAP